MDSIAAMTAERSLHLDAIAFISSEKPLLSIAADREKLTLPLGSMPVAEKESLDTSIPTKRRFKAAPP
ncbi:MAG: hypothetical protein QMD07_00855 [Thermodesulfovibrionales bacterium]|nr:hypothetical protein [Thermodesulfovibrionales bacterium]